MSIAPPPSQRLLLRIPYSDVIDTEPASGDMKKMLLGSFVEEYDRLEPFMTSPVTPGLQPLR